MNKFKFVISLVPIILLSVLLCGCMEKIQMEETREPTPIDLNNLPPDLSLDDLKELNGEDPVIVYDTDGSISLISCVFSPQLVSPTNEEEALLAVSSIRGLLGITDMSGFVVIGDGDGRTFYFGNVYNGVWVDKNDFILYINRETREVLFIDKIRYKPVPEIGRASCRERV